MVVKLIDSFQLVYPFDRTHLLIPNKPKVYNIHDIFFTHLVDVYGNIVEEGVVDFQKPLLLNENCFPYRHTLKLCHDVCYCRIRI